MAKSKVILKFDNFKDRDEWVTQQNEAATRVYAANPWVSADLSSDQLEELNKRADVQVHPDVGLMPTEPA